MSYFCSLWYTKVSTFTNKVALNVLWDMLVFLPSTRNVTISCVCHVPQLLNHPLKPPWWYKSVIPIVFPAMLPQSSLLCGMFKLIWKLQRIMVDAVWWLLEAYSYSRCSIMFSCSGEFPHQQTVWQAKSIAGSQFIPVQEVLFLSILLPPRFVPF